MGFPICSRRFLAEAYSREGLDSACLFFWVSNSIDLAPLTSILISRPLIAIGKSPTGVRTEYLPPMLSGIINVS